MLTIVRLLLRILLVLVEAGGCIIMLPALYFLYRYSLPMAIETTITAVAISASSGAIAHIRIKNVDYNDLCKV